MSKNVSEDGKTTLKIQQGVELRSHISAVNKQLQEITRLIENFSELDSRPAREQQGEAINDEYSEDNPYSRLVAAQQLGLFSEYEQIRGKSVAIVGCGGIGVQVTEILTRYGVGMVSLYDRNKVKKADLCRMFFRPDHIGWSKVQVARHFLAEANPDVIFRTFSYDVGKRYEDFVVSLRRGSIDESLPVDLVICCVDNVEARNTVNEACQELNVPFFSASIDNKAMKGEVRFISPGRTGCLQCAQKPGGGKKGLLKSNPDDPTHVAFPSSDAVIAGLVSNEAVKLLFGFGKVKNFMINLMTCYVTTFATPINASCMNELCKKRQEEVAKETAPVVEETAVQQAQ